MLNWHCPSLKIFLCRVARKTIPVNSNLANIGVFRLFCVSVVEELKTIFMSSFSVAKMLEMALISSLSQVTKPFITHLINSRTQFTSLSSVDLFLMWRL